MICLIQRVTQGQVAIDSTIVGKIGPGLVILTGFQPNDSSAEIQKMVHKLLHYRVFNDVDGKMNLNVQQINGGLLLIPQFTLAANTQKGLRPSFSSSMAPANASVLFDEFVNQMQQQYIHIQSGQFGANMQVSLTNDGPVTFWLET